MSSQLISDLAAPQEQQVIESCEATKATPLPAKRLRVVLMDLWCFIPYYMAALTQGLAHQNIDAALLSSSYRFDPEYFHKNGLLNNRGFLDVVSRRNMRPAWLRRALKLAEYGLNLMLLTLRLLISPPDIIHVQYLALLAHGLPPELWILAIAKRLKVRLVCTVHNLLPHDTGNTRRPGFQRLYSMADMLICHNQATRRRLQQEFGIAEHRIQVIAHGPLQQLESPLTQKEARRNLQLPEDRVVVLWQGVIVPYKGIEFLLEAWKNVSPRALLVIAGTGDEQMLAAIRKKVIETTLNQDGRVRLDFGFIPPEQLPSYYQAADALVYPYSQITTSGALLTGLGYGKAMVATRLPAFEEMLRDGQEALLVPYDDTRALAEAINSLVNDGALRTRLGQAAKLLAANTFSWEQIAARTRQAYDTLPEQRASNSVS